MIIIIIILISIIIDMIIRSPAAAWAALRRRGPGRREHAWCRVDLDADADEDVDEDVDVDELVDMDLDVDVYGEKTADADKEKHVDVDVDAGADADADADAGRACMWEWSGELARLNKHNNPHRCPRTAARRQRCRRPRNPLEGRHVTVHGGLGAQSHGFVGEIPSSCEPSCK